MKQGAETSSIFKVNSKQHIPRALNPSRVQQGSLNLSQKKSKVVPTLSRQSHKESQLMNTKEIFSERHQPISTLGLYSKQMEGVADAEPKVFETIVPIPGRVPRRVEIDRKKKDYKSFNIEQLLEDAGIHKDEEPNYLNWLPLELFDDETFDDYAPQEWIEKAKDGTESEQLALKGKGCYLEDGHHTWKDVLIHTYYEPDREFVCTFKDGIKVRFKRIDLWFEIEDPRKFVARVKKAHEIRKIADSRVRYNYYIDNMPRLDVNQMDTEQRNRLFNNASDTKSIRPKKQTGPTFEETLKGEAALEYERTMNKIIFNEYFKEANPDLYNPYNIEVPEEPEIPVPYYGIIETPKAEQAMVREEFEYPSTRKFTEIFKDFIFSSLFIREEVIVVLQDIKMSCKKVQEDDCLFMTKYNDIDRIEGFKQKQGGQISLLSNYLKETWTSDLTTLIRNKFSNVGKGWFNLRDANIQTYEFGKLKRFLTQVRLMMQDSLYTMIHRSLHDFRDYLMSFIPDQVIIENQSNVKNTFTRKIPERFKSNAGRPLIKIDLVRTANMNEFNYMTRPNKIVEEVLGLVSKGLSEMEKIPDLEPKILDTLFKAKRTESHILTPQLPKAEPTVPDLTERPKRYPDENKWVWDLYMDFKSIMEKAVEPLKEYTTMFDKYKDLISINPDSYIAELENKESSKTAEGLQIEIEKWSVEEAKVKEEIPEEIKVSCFMIDCRDLIRFLTGKYQDMNKRLIDLMARKARDKITAIKKNIEELKKLVRKTPENIEELTQMKQHNAEVLPNELRKIRNETAVVINIHDILESYEYKIPKEDSSRRWDIFKGPLEIEEIEASRRRDLELLDKEFLKEMQEDQVDFAKVIKQKEQMIKNLYQFSKEEKIEEYAQNMESYKGQLEKMRDTAALYRSRESKFGKDQTDYNQIDDLLDELTPYYNLWTQIFTWNKYGQKWSTDQWEKVDALKAEGFIENGYQVLLKSMRSFDPSDERYQELLSVAVKIKAKIEEFKPRVPLLVALKREGMADRHWKEITEGVGSATEVNPTQPLFVTLTLEEKKELANKKKPEASKKLKETITEIKYQDEEKSKAEEEPDQPDIDEEGEKIEKAAKVEKIEIPDEKKVTFNLDNLMRKGLMSKLQLCVNVGERAYKEFVIEKDIKNMKAQWAIQDYELQMPDKATTFLIKNFEELEAILDEHLSKTQALLINPYKEQFSKEIDDWNQKLVLISDTLEEWNKLQRNWKYLAPIFESPDIAKQMANESNNFKRVDANWKHTMNQVKTIPNVLKACTDDPVLEKFRESNKALEIIQMKLKDYLEKKRASFGRFYFLSDDDLLSILSQTKDVRKVQDHLRKVFENIAQLDFDTNDKILAMNSVEEEKVKFLKVIDPHGKQVEDWMSEVEREMKKTVKEKLSIAITQYPSTRDPNSDRNQWVLSHPGQCVLNGSQVRWTQEVEEAIETKFIDEYCRLLSNQLSKLIKIERTHLSKNQLITIEALIVIDVHALDITEKLRKIDKLDRYEWISQLRYYWFQREGDKTSNCWICCIQTEYPYGYEYLGNSNRLVITPLTDRCYITLMGALNLNIGGAPAGPAGTGKTESTKDLAKALAKQCVVFNCQESMDYMFVGKFFKGLATSGAWCCFDEFNRINLEVLSVIAQQLQELFTAKAKGLTSMMFQDSEIKLQGTFCVFITMNPGYKGRTELPDNLKALFRPVAMMVPDYAMIAEIKLFSFGFSKELGRELAKKLVATFKLSSEQMSSQFHYDYGMRAVSSVINAAGLLKRNPKLAHMSEDQLILKAIKDVNIPKFLKNDLPLFKYIIKDLFPETPDPIGNYGLLNEAILAVCQDKETPIQPTESFIEKVFQLFDTMQVRHGLMLVGPTGGGKTTNYKILQKAMTYIDKVLESKEAKKVNVEIINPKAVTMDHLYGAYKDMNWQEGIIQRIARKAINNQFDPDREKAIEKYWIMFDGPVDAKWIESMNTVLDDNKKLCLSSGEVLMLSNYITMMFEVDDLSEASPATVSRCGMVYMEPELLGLDPLITSFMQRIPSNLLTLKGADIEKRLKTLFEHFVPDTIKVLRRQCTEIMDTFNSNLIGSLLKLLWVMIKTFIEVDGVKKKPAELDKMTFALENYFLFCFIWSFTCSVNQKGRDIMDAFIKEKIQALGNEKITIPLDQSIFDSEYIFNDNKWREWNESYKNFSIPHKATFSDVVVPTTDYCRTRNLLSFGLTNKLHMLLVGPTGTGKSVNSVSFLSEGLTDRFVGTSVVLSAQTSSIQLQDTIFQQLIKRKKGVYGPEGGKTCICLVDDLNMPKKEEYGAQPPIELLRQYLDHKAWYIIQMNKEYTTIEDVILLGAMGPPSGRGNVTERIVRHFNIVCLTEMSKKEIYFIFKTVLDHFMRNLSPELKPIIDTVVTSTQDIFTRVREALKPIPSKSHYTFNLRDIAKVVQGVAIASQPYIKNAAYMSRLWYHENMRVFHDRLTTEEDRNLLKDQLKEIVNNQFNVPTEELFSSETIIFCDFTINRFSDNPDYIQIDDPKILEDKLDELQLTHNEGCKSKDKLDLVMFFDACEHVTRITRVLRQPQGSVLLLGVGGSGRQSLTRLSAFIRNMDLKQIQVIKGYNFQRWRDDLKNILTSIIEYNKQTCFSVVDTQIVDEQMVEDINCLLNSGWVVGLPFSADETEKLDDIGRRICSEQKTTATRLNVFNSQIGRIKKNLHISFAMSPLSDQFLNRMRMFPSFVNCCTIDWFTEWPEEALKRVGKKEMMRSIRIETSTGEDEVMIAEKLGVVDQLDQIVQMFMIMHKSVEAMSVRYRNEVNRHNYVTPKSYLELLSLFRKVIEMKNDENVKSIKRLENGIQMLKDADIEVARLNSILQEERPKLAAEEASVKEDMKVLDKDKAVAEEYKKTVEYESKEAAKEQEKAFALEQQVNREFQEGKKFLEEAREKLKDLTKDSLKELVSYQNQNDALKLLAFTSNVLLEQNPNNLKGWFRKDLADQDKNSWNEFKKKAKTTDLKEDLVDVSNQFDQKEKFMRVKTYVDEELIKIGRDKFWSQAAMDRVSVCCGQLFTFVFQMLRCFEIYLKNEPLRVQLEECQAVVAAKNKLVNEKKAELKNVIDRVRKLEMGVIEKETALKLLQSTIQNNELKLERANKLKSLLKDEKERWNNDVSNLTLEKKFIPGNCLVSAGMVAYSGPFTVEYRGELESSWLEKLEQIGLPSTEGTCMRKYLANPIDLMSWNVNGLPKDDTSTENGVMLEFTERWPLMIDPQTQANKFIKRMIKERGENSDTIKASQSNLMKIVEAGIHFGKTILVENVGIKLDPALEPILLKQTTFDKGSRSKTMALGDKTITYHDSFKFLMTTTNPNPHYSPETCAKVTIINFGITMTGLVEQMLATIVILENRKLEDSKNEIVKSNADDRKELFDLENKILSSLSESQGKILEEDTIIDQLSNAKSKSTMIMQRVAESKITEAKIDESRNIYRQLAFRTAVLFFCIVDLSNIDPMYQYSLQWYENLFKVSVDHTPAAKHIEDRLNNLRKWFTESLYKNVCRSLFGTHKLLFSFLMTTRLLTYEGDTNGGKFDVKAFRHLLTGAVADIEVPEKSNKLKDLNSSNWIEIYKEFYGLDQIDALKGILKDFAEKTDEWMHLYGSTEPIKEALPGQWDKLDLMYKILIVKAIRPDKVTSAVTCYVEDKIGKFYIDIPIVKLEECFDDSSCTIPLIFILSQGSDPKADFDSFANSKKMTDIRSISLGQGQGEKARDMIEKARTGGGWVLLQNCHLAASWMSELEAIAEALGEQGTHKDFRLWLTSMPSGDFPISVLQNSVKMTIEPPQGIKDNLKKSYEAMNKEELNDKDVMPNYKRLLYGLCFFHAIIQDRRKFGPIGWNIQYAFTLEDLDVCKKQLKLFLAKSDEIPFEVIRTLCAEINYGGRVTDKKDQILIQSIVNKFISREMLVDGYDFVSPGDNKYTTIAPGTHQDYLDHINNLPYEASPEIFGLHPNAAITYAQTQTRMLLENLLSIQPRDIGGSSDARSAIILETSQIVEKKTPELFDLEKVRSIYPPTDYNESMNTVLVQELIRCNRLLARMVDRLKDLKLAIKGEIVMSDDLEAIANSFYILQVPEEWEYPLGFLSLKSLNSWVEELNQRVNFFNTWIKEGQPNAFWMSGFFFPQSFITGTLQNYARRNKISIDQIGFEYEVLESNKTLETIRERPDSGVYVYGIYLEGARWDEYKRQLAHSNPKELYSSLPMMHLKTTNNREQPVSDA